MVYKYNFSIRGDSFYPEKIVNKIQGDFIIGTYFSPSDKKFANDPGEYGYGGMSFWHPNKFSTEDQIVEYEKSFIDFIEKNHSLFIKNGADNLQIYLEIYYDGGQCNFEIFCNEALKKIACRGVSLPISIYILKADEIKKWEREITLKWKN